MQDSIISKTSVMHSSAFLPLFTLRAANLMWFLGAGASAAAGIPTAWNMIWDFKRTLYCASQKVPVSCCQDLSNPRLRATLQQYLNNAGGFPAEDAEEEYTTYFERVHPNEADRRAYIERLIARGSPSYGHLVMAALMSQGQCPVVWTTNFDRMIESAAANVLGNASRLVTAGLDNAYIGTQALSEGRHPILMKLHGDFQSRRLKNTREELLTQDVEMRRALVRSCGNHGLIVVGYSGRDHSIMDALEEGIAGGQGFPNGLFWVQRHDGKPLDRVTRLLAKAQEQGIEAHLVEAETFDEFLSDLLLLLPSLPPEVAKHLNRPQRVSDAVVPQPSKHGPTIRVNALRVQAWPAICRLVECEIGGSREVRAAIEAANAAVIAVRKKEGVLAFGQDDEIQKAFGGEKRSAKLEIFNIATYRLGFDSQELGLIYDALACAIGRECPVSLRRQHHHALAIVDPARKGERVYAALRGATNGVLTGTVPKTEITWAEALRFRLDFKLDRLWLLVEPTVWREESNEHEQDAVAREFVRARLASRFNKGWNTFLQAWCDVLTDGQQRRTLRAFGIGDGLDASFTIVNVTAFSRWRSAL